MFIYKTAKFALVWTTILKIRAIFVHQTLSEHALFGESSEIVGNFRKTYEISLEA